MKTDAGRIAAALVKGRRVALEAAAPLPFDSVIIASGATAGYFGVRGAAEFSFPLYTLTDARLLRDPVLRPYKRKVQSLTEPLPWRADGAAFHPRVVEMARSFGYT